MRKISSITCIIFGCGMFAFSDVIVSVVSNIPTDNVLIGNATGTAGLGWRNNGTDPVREIGQSFLASMDTIMDSFSLKAGGGVGAGASGAGFSVTIYSNSVDTTLGTAISTQTGTYLTTSDGVSSGAWITFDLEDNINLYSGNYYTFTLTWDDPAVPAKNQNFFHQNTGSTFSEGRLWQNNGSSWAASGVADFVFVVQAIPEPVSAGLLTIGGVALMFFRKRFKK
ncbi:MAG: PEP-CTERM sorting domain-containing protein [Kiritimatiellales bacterium]